MADDTFNWLICDLRKIKDDIIFWFELNGDLLGFILIFCVFFGGFILIFKTDSKRAEHEAKLQQEEILRYDRWRNNINRELSALPWNDFSEDFQLFPPDNAGDFRVILVDAETHRVSDWNRVIVPSNRYPQILTDCDYVILIDERWEKSNVYFVYNKIGGEPTRVPIKYCIWDVSVLLVRYKRIVARRSFQDPPQIGLLEGMLGPGGSSEDYERDTIPIHELKAWLTLKGLVDID